MYAIGISFLKGVKYERGKSKSKNSDLAAELPSVDLRSVSLQIMHGFSAKMTLHLYLESLYDWFYSLRLFR